MVCTSTSLSALPFILRHREEPNGHLLCDFPFVTVRERRTAVRTAVPLLRVRCSAVRTAVSLLRVRCSAVSTAVPLLRAQRYPVQCAPFLKARDKHPKTLHADLAVCPPASVIEFTLKFGLRGWYKGLPFHIKHLNLHHTKKMYRDMETWLQVFLTLIPNRLYSNCGHFAYQRDCALNLIMLCVLWSVVRWQETQSYFFK